MKLTVIGCWGGYPKVNEASTGYLLEHDGFRLLIDCGSGVLSKLQQYVDPTDLDACIVTHYHADHIADIGVLQHALIVQKYLQPMVRNLPIYGHQLDEQAFRKLTYKDITTGKAYDPSQTLRIGPFTISFLPTVHPVPCFAFRIEAAGKIFVFTGDSAFQDSFIEFAKDANLLLCECNFYANMDGGNAGHMNSKDAGTLAAAANVKQLVLTHLPQYGIIENLVTEAGEYYDGRIHLAEGGQVWEI
ncbi:MBL fold metallo-hydrolase [Caldibacillus lycopersici]|uniref:MBL fold metallo-hydrolase n=1 Tax=Perspicuibacillus lycopersici TaxID=1325689 RepID=A0AAE3ITK6_9BACI|nr:MBL fold metallo-hydrolase [Perspicuibacillus lycopersici]MCU9612494.1 MBL fold metallo-hydrolase [Perspicuibacillus lycopersici]